MNRTFFLLLMVLLLACDRQELSVDSPPVATGINYLALGDSYTIGQSVDIEECYPLQLQSKLESEGVLWDSTTIIAQTGWRTDQLQAAVEAADLLAQYDLVSLLIGVNNQFQGGDIISYENGFRKLLERAIALAGDDPNHVFVVSIPDYAFTPFGQNSASPEQTSMDIDLFNKSNKIIAENYGVSYFDSTPISREGLDHPALVASDGLHPSGLMYAEWVELIWEAILEKVK